MNSIQGVHFSAFAVEYDAILAQAKTVIEGLPPLLRRRAELVVPPLLQGDFCRLVALLPYWVADLLDGCDPTEIDTSPRLPQAHPPVPDEYSQSTQTLGLSQLLGCWSYLIQDSVLDGQKGQSELLPLAMAFHAVAIRLLTRLLPDDEAFWWALERLAVHTAEAQCREQGQRIAQVPCQDHATTASPPSFPEVSGSDLERLVDRSDLLQVTVAAQLALRGYPQDDPRGVASRRMLRQYSVARQIGDDRSDWIDDLRRGQVNYVSARIASRMKETGTVQSYAELDIDRMTGYFLYDDDLFAEIQLAAMEACGQAAEAIALYEPLYLGALVDELAHRLDCGYEEARAHRSRLRAVLSPLQSANRARPQTQGLQV